MADLKSVLRLSLPLPSWLRVAWLLPLVLASCLEFEQQELHLRYDADQNRMDVLLVYRGLYAGDANHGFPVKTHDPLQRALSDWKQAREHGAFAFRSSSNFKVDPVEEAGSGWVSQHIDVEHGGLFTDPKGRLCGYQFVRVRDFRAFLPKFDEAHRMLLFSLFGPAVDAENGWPEAATQRFLDHMEQGNALITADGCCFDVRLPIREQDHDPVKRFVIGDSEKKPADAPPAQQPAAGPRPVKLRRSGAAPPPPPRPNPLTVRRDGDVTIVRYGTPGAAAMRVDVACGKGNTELLDELRKLDEAIEVGVPDQALLRRFAEFGERDAVLPPALAKLRR